MLVLGTPLRDFLWNGFTEVGCGSTKVESTLENSAVKWGQEYQPKEFKVEKKYGSQIYLFPECWRAGSLFPIATSEWQSVKRVCGLCFVCEQMLKRVLLGQQCLYKQRRLMLYNHPNFSNHLRGKLVLFPGALEIVCVFSEEP